MKNKLEILSEFNISESDYKRYSELYKILNVDTSEYEEEVLINLNLEKIYELLS